MDFDEWWELNGDCKHPDILTQEAWNYQQQRIAALEADNEHYRHRYMTDIAPAKEYEQRIEELEAENRRLREAADDVLRTVRATGWTLSGVYKQLEAALLSGSGE